MLALLLTYVPMIPKLVEAGLATYEAYDKVQTIINENRKPNEPEWDALEAQINEDRARLHDTSKDI